MICNTVMRNICMKRKKGGKRFVLVATMRWTCWTYTWEWQHISCIVLFTLLSGSVSLNYDNNHFTWKSAGFLRMMCFCIYHHYFTLMMVINEGWAEVSYDWNRWITGLNQCIELQSVAPCGEYLCAVNHPHCAFDVTFKKLHLHTSMWNIAFWSLYFWVMSRPILMNTTH